MAFGLDDALSLASTASSFLGPVLGARSAASANEANVAASQRQMDFQERMRATQYQTAVADLKAAGLNPMLAYTNGGAGTPSGAMAVSQPEFSPQSFSSAAQASILRSQSAKAAAEVRNVEADTRNKQAQTAVIQQDAALRAAQLVTESFRPGLVYGQGQQASSAARLSNAIRNPTVDKLVSEAARNRASAEVSLGTLLPLVDQMRAAAQLSRSSASSQDVNSYLMKQLVEDNSFAGKAGAIFMDLFRNKGR